MCEDRILIVDNNKAFCRLYENNLSEVLSSKQVFTARNGMEALRQLASHPCGLIIADADSPKINRLKFIRVIHQQRPETQILLMSIRDVETVEIQARNNHIPIDGCLNKTGLLIRLWECESRKIFD